MIVTVLHVNYFCFGYFSGVISMLLYNIGGLEKCYIVLHRVDGWSKTIFALYIMWTAQTRFFVDSSCRHVTTILGFCSDSFLAFSSSAISTPVILCRGFSSRTSHICHLVLPRFYFPHFPCPAFSACQLMYRDFKFGTGYDDYNKSQPTYDSKTFLKGAWSGVTCFIWEFLVPGNIGYAAYATRGRLCWLCSLRCAHAFMLVKASRAFTYLLSYLLICCVSCFAYSLMQTLLSVGKDNKKVTYLAMVPWAVDFQTVLDASTTFKHTHTHTHVQSRPMQS